ncbi:RNA polymerase sigma factor [Paenibacillus sp. OK003]|uniref:RNA polymerase sigma factor n=1 Tax=Paenibacillus sp. OK003 TaxID=1884380 RepID=UPI0008BE6B4D|nr:sigma-70 family RNA polymerase sigma factor [Paenibacillus sp. OK003]SEL68450.1 RNA polymerase sigma-70 factor, ECF subfamily [Paenibacillus sp. OK003]
MEQWFYFLRNPLDDLDVTIQELVYRSFYQFVYQDIRFMVYDHSLTEDIIQESFMKAITKGPKMRTDTNILAWIKQLTRNTTLDYIRRVKRDRQMLTEPYVNISSTACDEISVACEVEARERDELLHQTISELKSEYRTILLLFYMEGKSYREVCLELKLTEPVLTQRLARARKKLLQQFLRKWTDDNE